jgi:hypothetical protein
MYSEGTWRAHSVDFQDESSAGESQKSINLLQDTIINLKC